MSTRCCGGVHDSAYCDPFPSFALAAQQYFNDFKRMPSRIVVPPGLWPSTLDALIKACHCGGCVVHDPAARVFLGARVEVDPTCEMGHYYVRGEEGEVVVRWH